MSATRLPFHTSYRIGCGALLVAFCAVEQAGAAPATPLRITEVSTSSALVEVTNTSTASYTVPSAMPFSHLNNTATSIAGGTVFASGESKLFTVAGLSQTDSDLWLYRDTNFASGTSIESGLKYGPAANVGRTSLAVAAGLWPSTTAFVPVPANPSLQSLALIAHYFVTDTAWAAGTPTYGKYFGTGTTITNPLPPIQPGSVVISLVPVAQGLAAPLGIAAPDDGTNRLFVYDQGGTVTLILNGVQQPTPALDVSGRLVKLGLFPPLNYDERGLLGLACHPNFATNPKIYTFTTEPVTTSSADFSADPSSITNPGFGYDNQCVIAEWTASISNPNVFDPASRRELMRINHPQFNHDGGTVRFGHDGMLYISMGDGGQSNDVAQGHLPGGNAQSLTVIFGKVLRINVDGNNSANGKYGIPADNPFVSTPGAVKEIFAYGLRNPYAFSFDPGTGDLWLGDAGQNKVEEVDLVTTGANCGWNDKEGSFYFDSASGQVKTIPVRPLPANLLDPIAEYDRDDGSVVIGGTVYRGTAIPALIGRYITGDFGSFGAPTGRVFYLDAGNQLKSITIDPTTSLNMWLKGIGQDRAGEVYLCTSTVLGPFGTTGKVYKIMPGTTGVADWKLFD